MHQELVKTDRRKLTGRKQRRDTCASYLIHQDLLGVAIVRRVYKELGLLEARRVLRASHELGLNGNVFRAVVTNRDFRYCGYFRLCRLAEVFGLDPPTEVVAAYSDPRSVTETCRRYKIELCEMTKSALARFRRQRPSVADQVGSAA